MALACQHSESAVSRRALLARRAMFSQRAARAVLVTRCVEDARMASMGAGESGRAHGKRNQEKPAILVAIARRTEMGKNVS
jgi:hypothetical protein